jgi:hypothetical protein
MLRDFVAKASARNPDAPPVHCRREAKRVVSVFVVVVIASDGDQLVFSPGFLKVYGPLSLLVIDSD